MSEQEHEEQQKELHELEKELDGNSIAAPEVTETVAAETFTLAKGGLWPQPTRLHPSALLLDYSRQLVNRIEETRNKNVSEETELLLQVTQLAIDSDQAFRWDPSFIETVARILRHHPSLEKTRKEESTRKLLEKLDIFQPGKAPVPEHCKMTSSFITGIADRIAEDRGLAQIISELGPSSTRMVSTLREVIGDYTRTSGPVNEAAIAGLLVFFSNAPPQEVVGLSSVLLGSIVPGRGQEGISWNLEVVAQVLSEDYANIMDWRTIAHCFDLPSFVMKDTNQFGRLLDLYRAGSNTTPPLAAFTGQWHNASGQLSALEAILSVPASVFPIPLDDEELADAATSTATTSAPHPQCWASQSILQRILQLSEIPSLYRRVRDLFVRCLVGCPEILLCSLVRLQLRVANQNEEVVNTGVNLKQELMRELIPLFFRPSRHRVGPAAIRRLYAISATTVIVACWEAYRGTLQEPPSVRLASILHIISLARLLPNTVEAVGSLLSGNQDLEYSIALAFVMADHDYLQLNAWLTEKLSKGGAVGSFAVSLVSYLQKNYAAAGPKKDGALGNAPLVSLENIVISLKLLQALDRSILNHPVNGGGILGEAVQSLVEHCLATHPSLRNAVPVNNTGASNEVEKMATLHFQKIYTSEQSIGDVVEMLKRFKNSGDSKENDIFACMVHNLYDEYRFFAKYPDRELRITGILFGALIQEQLVSSITLGIALRYVLEALRKPPSPPGTTTSNGKMFQFGMFALEQFKGRLHEWPQYCSHIVQIPHLKEGYAELVAEIQQEMVRGKSNPSPPAQPSNDDAASLPDPVIQAGPSEKRIANFGPKLGRAVTDVAEEEKEHESPTDATLDRVQFLINNLAMSNVEKKASEIKDMLDPKFFGWLAHYLVVKRISTQANYHSLYLSFLDNLGEYGSGLVEAILTSVYHNIGKLLRSSKITTSSSERGYLKNLGIWLGQMTLSRNRPIKQIMLDCKELLLQGYETGKLIAVAPFLAKMLEGAKSSVIFRPPNPWLMAILGVFRSIYNIEELKMNIKFEIEVLCKNLSVKLEDIPLRDGVLSSRIAPVKERNPDFNFKTSNSSIASDSNPVATTTHTDQPGQNVAEPETVIPNLSSYVTVNSSLPQLLQSQASPALASLNTAALKRFVPMAVDRAIREIIQPVVERSVTIACITTKEIVTKDFAMESDESKMRKAGQLMVANLAGSLALVTCREPLRSSVSSHLRQLLTSSARSENLGEQDQNVIEQCVQICATDNLELGCKLIEKAATEKAVRDVDEALGGAMSTRRKHREQTGQPFFDMSIFSNENGYPAALPDQLRPSPGGLLPEHFQLYESFQRTSRQTQVHGSQISASSSAVSAPAPPQVSVSHEVNELSSNPRNSQQIGTEGLGALASRLDAAITSLLTVAGARAREIKLAMLPADHQICRLITAVKDAMPNSGPNGPTRSLSTAEQEMILGFSQGVFKRLYELSLTEPLRLESLVALLANINSLCPKLGKDMGTWATYAPTNTEQQRRLHRTVLLLLVRSRLLSIRDLDSFLATRADNGRNSVWVEFAIVFLRTALLENIAAIIDFPKIVDLMERIVEGRSQVSAQIARDFRQPIFQILEESRSVAGVRDSQPTTQATPPPTNTHKSGLIDGSSLSAESLTILSGASLKIAEATNQFAKSDPETDQKQISTLLETWIRLQADSAGNDKISHFLLVLQQWGVGKIPEKTERFFRVSTVTVAEVALKAATNTEGTSKLTLNYGAIDMFCKLLHLVFKRLHTAGSPEQIHAQRLGMLNKILGTIVRTMIWHNAVSKSTRKAWDQRPWYRILLNLVIDFNKPDQHLEPIKLGILSVFGAAFHVCQPLVLPGFAFSWLELVSHRHFLPNLLLFPGQKAWHIAHELLVDQFLSLEPYLRKIELTEPVKKLYQGTLRVLLVLMHDVPAFLSGYHLSFCNVIPETCVQLRNIVLAASPKGLAAPDPFTPNLKIDLLPETSQAPSILSNVIGPIEKMRSQLDAYVNDSARRSNFLSGILPNLCLPGTREVDAAKVNALVLYVGARSLAQVQSPQISLSRTPGIEILEKLMEFDDRGRYVCLNAIANQLRFPSSHTHYFSCVMLYLFSESKSVAVKEQVTRVLLERLIVHRPHPWGILITFIELIKNQRYAFWSYPFTRSASEIEKVFESVSRSCMPPGQRASVVGDDPAQ